METTMRRVFRSRWWMPSFCVALGLAVLAASWAGDDLRGGIWGLAMMTALGAVFLFGGRSETLSGLGSPAATSAGRRSTCAPPLPPAWC